MRAPRRTEIAFVIALLLVVVALAWAFYNRHLDRSFITYRVVQNLAGGQGFTYNSGEQLVLHDVISPLYVLVLRLLLYIPVDLPGIGNLLSVLSIVFGAGALYGMARQVDWSAAVSAAAIYLMFPLLWVTLGLDIHLWMACSLLAVWFYLQEWTVPAGVLLAIAILLRPEAGALAVILAADFIASGRPFKGWGMGVFAILLGAGWIWFIAAFDAIGPTPGASGSAVSLIETGASPNIWTALAAMAVTLFNQAPEWLPVLLVGIPGIILLKDHRWALLLLGWGVLHIVVLGLLRTPVYSWTLMPVIPALAALAALGLHGLAGRLPENLSNPVASILLGCLIGAAGITLVTLALEPVKQTALDPLHPPLVDPAYQQAGRWIRDNLPSDAIIGTTQPGLLGYEAHRTLIDYQGYFGTTDDFFLAPGDGFSWIAYHTPEVLVLRASEAVSLSGYNLAGDNWFTGTYTEMTRLTASRQPGDSPPTRQGSDPVVIYRRAIERPAIQEAQAGMVIISDDLTLNRVGTDFSLSPLEGGRPGLVSIEWLVGPNMGGEQYVSIRIQNREGAVVALGGRTLSFEGWPTRTLITSYHWVDLAPSPSPGAYTIEVGLGPTAFDLTWYTAAEAKVPFENAVFLGAFSGARIEFGDIALVGYRLAENAEGLDVLLLWEAIRSPMVNYQIIIQVRDGQGAIAIQAEAEPYGGAYPTSIWSAGEQVPDTVHIDVSGLLPGEYEVYVGMSAPDGTRLRTPQGHDAVFVGRVHTGSE